MVTTGSKYFFGLAVVGFFTAIAYGVIMNGTMHGGVVHVLGGPGAVDALLGPLTLGYKGGVGDALGYSILMGFSACTFGLGVMTSAFRDADPEALAELAGTSTAPSAVSTAGHSYWPLVMSFGAAMVIVGLATSSFVFTAGWIVIVVSGLEWTILAWSESQTADAALNAQIRSRLRSPIEIPATAVIGIGLFVFSVSRVFLSASKLGAVWIALLIGVLIFGGALILNSRPELRRRLILGVLVLGAIGVLAIGIVGAIVGPREFERHGDEPAAKQEKAGPVAPSTTDSARPPVMGETA